jgi:hypothetical protein
MQNVGDPNSESELVLLCDCGFVLGTIGMLWVVPRIGTRSAELLSYVIHLNDDNRRLTSAKMERSTKASLGPAAAEAGGRASKVPSSPLDPTRIGT